MKSFYAFVLLLFAVACQTAMAQSISNEGTEFWTVFPTHDASMSLAVMNINITSKSDSEVTLTCGSWTSGATPIKANTVVTFLVPRANSYINYSERNVKLENRAIHIVVSPRRPKVVAYSHVFASNRSAATLILPVEALGQKYLSMNYLQDQDEGRGGNLGVSRNFLTLVAAEDDTHLLIKKTNGEVLAVVLPKKGDVYEYMPADLTDLTGLVVEVEETSSCKKFAAFSGSTSVSIGCTDSRDPLLQQLYAINSWGKVYGVVPFVDRRYIVRVLAQAANTTVKLNGNTVAVLKSGEYYEQTLTSPSIISADKVVSVAEYSYTQACSSIFGNELPSGDPEMVLLNPVEFNVKNITVFSSDMNRILSKYVNVFMKTAKTATFRLNGAAPNGTWQTMPSDPSYSYIQIQVYDKSLTLTADDGFNAIAYGFGQTESYAYSAGTNLATTQFLELVNNFSNTTNSSACVGQTTDFKLTMPYLLSKITWKFNDGKTPDFVDLNPTYTTAVNTLGEAMYTYISAVHQVFSDVGTANVTAIVVLKNPDVPCIENGELELDFTVEVNAIATANFDEPQDVCAGATIPFFDLSQGSSIMQWKWDFDGVIKTEKNPTHVFAKGKHTIKLAVANASGCWSDVVTRTIDVDRDFPAIEFKAQQALCIDDAPRLLVATENKGLAATAKFFSLNGVKLLNDLFDPAKAGVGIHQIDYTFISAAGCTDVVSQHIEVYAITKIKAEPMVYILAGGKKNIPALIENFNPTYKYKYQWTPATGLDRSDVLSPVASPLEDTDYQLSISIDGKCEQLAKVTVKVLGDVKPPNSFSPNGDGVNDIWNIKSIDSYPDALIQVFNRNGQKVFTSLGYATPFNGTYKNEPLPVGVYYYVIDPKNGRKAITGSLTIIR